MVLIGRLMDVVGGTDIWGVALCDTAARFRSGRQTLVYTFTSRVMARYTPGPVVLATETDFLQAYEDVLEKYKGNFSACVCVFWMTPSVGYEDLKISPESQLEC